LYSRAIVISRSNGPTFSMILPAKRISERAVQTRTGGEDDEVEAGTLHAGVQAGGGRLVESGQSQAEAAHSLGVVGQGLGNWVKTHRVGALKDSGKPQVSAEQMKNSRLLADLARTMMERDILHPTMKPCRWAPAWQKRRRTLQSGQR
jgi:transposase-like protein